MPSAERRGEAVDVDGHAHPVILRGGAEPIEHRCHGGGVEPGTQSSRRFRRPHDNALAAELGE
ncbi:hypothetical protein GCM10025866_36330 [Naasia aerilata]|uniref:Uncharacterized protein n=1 Tax=Naasia aerilata TaxID=1162966 RepID=A0ABM8GHS0_9MICO|nr:hypothetical protein GCM10025866_36330 [Naasia aerilata]